MTHTKKGLSLSFLLHVVLVMCFLEMGGWIKYDKPPLVIDFTCESGLRGNKAAPVTPIKKEEKHTEEITRPSQNVQPPQKKPAVKSKKAPKTDLSAAPLHAAPIPADPAPAETPPASIEQEKPDNAGGCAPGNGLISGEGGEGGVNSNSEEQETRYLKEHLAYIRDLILKNITFPPAARRMGWSGRVTVSFSISEKGHVDNIKIVDSSGYGLLDNNAVETIKRVSTFPKPPVAAQLTVPIIYELN